MNDEHKPPVTIREAIDMVQPLDPYFSDFTKEEKQLAYDRLIQFFELLLPKE